MSDEKNHYLHEVVITAIIIDGERYLITRRPETKKRFPGMWTVPGGRLEPNDYLAFAKDTEAYWYNVLERVVVREVQEEVGLEINNVRYLTSLATVHDDGNPSIVISCIADFVGGDVRLQAEEADRFLWVTTEESKQYPLIDGIYEEFVMIDRIRKGEKNVLWMKATGNKGD